MIDGLDIRVRGIVQGVGFRPFVYRLAKRYLVNGWVLNDKDGVFIHAEAESALLDGFVMELVDNPPAAAQVKEVELTEVPLQDCITFEIRESVSIDTDDITKISPDLGICDQCVRELFDPADRRFRYPFINCTDCGPRFTIIRDLPYDRGDTSMAPFTMCPQCAAEYGDPENRRFHAQPDACFVCGPSLSWIPCGQDAVVLPSPSADVKKDREASDAILAAAVEVLRGGGILAVKGLGGFHLVCDGENPQAIAELRRRKHRDGKPFAVMMADVAAARSRCVVSEAEEALLRSPARPILLLEKREDAVITPGLADGLRELGVMMPTTPLQCLLIHDFFEATGSTMLVMTSGNRHGEPIVIDDGEAAAKLGSVADVILGNDRPILTRFDDSVLRIVDLAGQEAVQFIRRARGYAPSAISLKVVEPAAEGETASGADSRSATGARNSDHRPSLKPEIFAAGSEQKNTFTFTRGEEAYVSQYIGDLEDADVFDGWLAARSRLQGLFALKPRVLACDSHPEYIASKWARSEAFKESYPLTEVQHHHAHIASVLGEHGIFGPCCGIAFDGTGFGADGAIWGGEVLVANQGDYERFANLVYAPMPGGVAAIKHPQRMAYGLLWAYDLLDHPGAQPMLTAMGEEAQACEELIESGLNTPFTSSMGRLFDGVSALLGVCMDPTYEGEAAILLDGCRADEKSQDLDEEAREAERYDFTIRKNSATTQSTAHDTSVVLLDGETTLRAVLDDVASGVPVEVISLRFHQAVVRAILQVAALIRRVYDIDLIALSGGCFMNRFLLQQSVAALEQDGFTVAINSSLPPNDGCVSYGQAVVASVSR